jgi:hypothetical protein
VGIEDADADGLTLGLNGLSLTVHNPQGHTLALFDMQGRLLASTDSRHATLALPAAGVYMLRAAGKSHKIIAL